MAKRKWDILTELWGRLSGTLKKIGDIQCRLLLSVVYFTLFLPMGIFVRFFSNSLTARPSDKSRLTYWKMKQRPQLDIQTQARRQF
jgi:hypothetical protein